MTIIKKQAPLLAAALLVAAMPFPATAQSINEVNFDQKGQDNSVYINQVGANTVLGSMDADNLHLDVQQIGIDNYAFIKQAGNDGSFSSSGISLWQEGDDNSTRIDSTSRGSDLQVEQYGNGNRTKIQGDSLSIVDVIQSGTSNHAELDQFGDLNEATITQDGEGNLAKVVQNSFISKARLSQFGTQNDATIQQESGGAIADVMQTGQNNRMFVHQR